MDIDFQDRIDEYILGRMSDEDRRQFENEVRQDEKKREQLELSQHVERAIRSRNDKLKAMSAMKDNYDEQNGYNRRYANGTYEESTSIPMFEQRPRRRKGIVIKWVSAIVGFAVVVAVGLFLTFPTQEKFNHKTVRPMLLVEDNFRGDNSLATIAQLVNSKHYEQALEAIKKEETEIEQSLKDLKKTVGQQERVHYQCTILVQQEYDLQWMKVNVFIGQGRMREAKKLLLQFRSKAGTYQVQADSLYRLLSKS